MESDLMRLEKELFEGSITAPHELGRIGSPQAVAILLDALENSRDTTRRAIIQALPVIPEIEPALINVLRSNREYTGIWDGMIHVDAVIKLSALGTSTAIEAVRQWTSDTLNRPDDNRFHAYQGFLSLSDIKDTASIPLFRSYLHDTHPYIRSAAISAVGKLRDIASVPDLIRLLSDKTEDPLSIESLICDTTAEALGEIGDERAVQPLAEMIANHETGMHALIAIRALGELSEKGFDTLLSIIPQASTKLKRDIIYSFGLIGNKRAVDLLLETLKSDDEFSRSNAVESLGNLRDDRTVGLLINVLSDKSSIVRYHTVYSLSKFRDARVTQTLISACRDENPRVRNAAISVLGYRSETQAVEVLISLLADTEQDNWHKRVCDTAAESLKMIGSSEAITAVEQWKQSNSSSANL